MSIFLPYQSKYLIMATPMSAMSGRAALPGTPWAILGASQQPQEMPLVLRRRVCSQLGAVHFNIYQR